MKKFNDQYSIPPGLNYLAGLSWRLLAILGTLAFATFLIIQLKVIVIPFLVGLLLTALMYPLVEWLVRKRLPRSVAVVTSILSLLILVSGLMWLVVREVRSAFPDMQDRFQAVLVDVRTALENEPFGVSSSDFNNFISEITSFVQNNSGTFVSGIATAGSAAGYFVTGLFLVIFTVIFLLLDGRNIWRWTTRLLPKQSQDNLFQAGLNGWRTLTSFVKSQVAVAGIDAVGIGLGAFFLSVPLALPIAVLVFLGSFIPVVGAVATGFIAVLIALIFNGWGTALALLAVVAVVQFVESQLLQPFLIGKAVSVHPLAIAFAVAIGALIAGIPGALFSVPFVAVLNVMAVSLAKNGQKPVKDIS